MAKCSSLHRLLLAALCATVVSGCASQYVIEKAPLDPPAAETPSMQDALAYSDRLKEAAVDKAKSQFNLGQGVNGVFIGAATAATSLLAFDGNQTAAAATGLGAGMLGIGDRFLLIDESLSVYKGAVDALTCAEGLLAPLAAEPQAKAGALFSTNADVSMMSINSEASFETFRKGILTAPVTVQDYAILTPTVSTLYEANIAYAELWVALANAADDGKDPSKRAANRLVLFVDQVRQSANATLLQKKATLEELAAAFKKSIADYLKELDDIKKKAEQKKKEAGAVQKAAVFSAAHLGTSADQNARLSTASVSDLAEIDTRLAKLDTLIAITAAAIPDESKVQACLVKIAGGGKAGESGGASPGS